MPTDNQLRYRADDAAAFSNGDKKDNPETTLRQVTKLAGENFYSVLGKWKGM